MGSCQNKAGIVIKSNRKNSYKKQELDGEKFQIDPRFEDMPEWPSKLNYKYIIKKNYLYKYI
jgi:hypothetical protein